MLNHWPLLSTPRCIPAVLACLALLLGRPSAAAAQASHRPDAYASVSARIDRLRKQPSCRVLNVGRSAEGRQISMLVITDPSHSAEISGRTRLLLLCGQHGDEPASVDAMLSLVQNLTTTSNPIYRSILRRNSILVVPTVNPDGLAHFRRQNRNGVDLNRNWTNPNQPETLAIMKIVKTYRPHVILDEHEWTSATGNKPNCVEVPLVENGLADRLCSQLAVAALSRMTHGGLPLSVLRYHPQSDQSLAHRHFNAAGITSMLIETSPHWSPAIRHRTYMDFTMGLLSALSDPPSPVLAARIGKTKSRSAGPGWRAIAALFAPKTKSHDYACYWALLAIVGAYAASLHSVGRMRQEAHGSRVVRGRTGLSAGHCAFAILQSDTMTAGEKLRLLRARREPPSTDVTESAVTTGRSLPVRSMAG